MPSIYSPFDKFAKGNSPHLQPDNALSSSIVCLSFVSHLFDSARYLSNTFDRIDTPCISIAFFATDDHQSYSNNNNNNTNKLGDSNIVLNGHSPCITKHN